MANAIKQQESKTTHCGRGLSGEAGCFQYLPNTWKLYSTDVLGYVAPQTRVNEEYVSTMKVEQWLEQGLSVKQIALRWNQGNSSSRCSSGINRAGVRYDSCGYVVAVLAFYNNQPWQTH